MMNAPSLPPTPSGMSTMEIDAVMYRHLFASEQACLRNNIIVRVDSIVADRRVAMCSVVQCLFGVFRRTVSSGELLWHAEQALAPLRAIGVTPLITVLRKPIDGNVHAADGPGGWPAAVWQWMGHPLARRGYGHRLLVRDPFGWRQAMAAATFHNEAHTPTT